MVHTLVPSSLSSGSTSDSASHASTAETATSSELFFLLHIAVAGGALSGSAEWRSRSDHIMLRLEANEVGWCEQQIDVDVLLWELHGRVRARFKDAPEPSVDRIKSRSTVITRFRAGAVLSTRPCQSLKLPFSTC